ncbi:MAG: selenocysteine-specific translation elongation factor [Geodermatophilaceae bacterium]|nr:selenocysteine-specific translation elongation factor [Geodermatophilaceae bacterium]
MYVLATAGHVDHGKSSLVRALTGIEPDRYAEERRRGLTLDLGFAWMGLPGGERLAFVDVPGHERFVSTMLAGVGPVPAVLLVVAADGGWSAQTQEHVAVLDALGVSAGLVVVTRSDLADPGPVIQELPDWLADTSLAAIPAVACSALTGDGLDDVRDALVDVVADLPEPDVDARTRLWIDRAFSIRGAGTVVTGTLNAGRIRVGDELVVARTGLPVVVRGLQSMNESLGAVPAVARVAVNLRGVSAEVLRRGDALLTPGRWALTSTVDAILDSEVDRLPAELTMHIGAGAFPVRTRRLGARGVRLSLPDPAALSYGDRVLLRDPGSRSIIGADVLDPLPRPLPRRRGAAVARGMELAETSGGPDPDGELRRRGIENAATFATLGLGLPNVEPINGWLVDPSRRVELSDRLVALAAEHRRQDPLDAGLTAGAIARSLGLPDARLLAALLRPPWKLVAGRVTSTEQSTNALQSVVGEKMSQIRERLQDNPFDAPTPSELSDLELTAAMLAAAVRAGLLIAVGDGVFLGRDAQQAAVSRLEALDQPFTTSQAREVLQTSRRVALPLLQWLDAAGVTLRLPDDRRRLRSTAVSHRD